MPVEYLGNKDILLAHKTAFLCSRQVSSGAVLRCYDWATEMRERGAVVVSSVVGLRTMATLASQKSP